MLEQVSTHLGVVIHSRASVSAAAQIAPGAVVLVGAVVNANASLHAGVLANEAPWWTTRPPALPKANSV